MTQGGGICTAARIATTGAGNDLYLAAKSSVVANLHWSDAAVAARMVVTCPVDSIYGNVAVTVALRATSPQFFGAPAVDVETSSTALNGQVATGDYSVALLDPSNPSWSGHGSRTGCASYLINGGVSVTYEGSIFVDSTCTRDTSSNGAVKAANSSFYMLMLNGATMRIGGEASTGTTSKIAPTPIERTRPLLPDPLSGLTKPCHATDATDCLGTASTLPARNTNTSPNGAQCFGTKVACVLSPGTYSGGLLAANGSVPSTLLLRPGVYFIEGGGLQLKSAAAQIISIPSATATCGGIGACTNANAIARYCNPNNNNNGSCQLTQAVIGANWQTDCPSPPAVTTCGVLVFNAKSDSKSSWTVGGATADAISNGSQGIMLLRAYNPDSDTLGTGSLFASYRNLVMWQARTPAPSASTTQPVVSMSGGACVVLAGTVYAPGAEVDFGGSSCGLGGGADAQLTLQFVAWDLTLAGNNNFYFAYRRNAFTQPFGYGIVK
jgi:hypothetical protein